MTIPSLYIHIPFCHNICHYCDFAKVFYSPELADRYLETLANEATVKELREGTFATVYVGGGTPTALSPAQLRKLLAFASSFIDKSLDYEFSIEANPADIDIAKIGILKEYGVNRISLGVQSFKAKTLATLGRDHSRDDIRFAIEMIKYSGISNFSVDLIYGVPGESQKSFMYSLGQVVKYKVPHISLYALSVEKNTMMSVLRMSPASQERQRSIYDASLAYLRREFYTRYEVSNFALPGFMSRHNLQYWRSGSYQALGVGAVSLVGARRSKNTSSLTHYLDGIIEHEGETLTRAQQIDEYLMLQLRLEEGVPLAQFRSRFGVDLALRCQQPIDDLIRRGLVLMSDDYLRASDEGMMLLDTVTLALITCLED